MPRLLVPPGPGTSETQRTKGPRTRAVPLSRRRRNEALGRPGSYRRQPDQPGPLLDPHDGIDRTPSGRAPHGPRDKALLLARQNDSEPAISTAKHAILHRKVARSPSSADVDIERSHDAVQIRIPAVSVTAVVEDGSALDLVWKEIIRFALADPLGHAYFGNLR